MVRVDTSTDSGRVPGKRAVDDLEGPQRRVTIKGACAPVLLRYVPTEDTPSDGKVTLVAVDGTADNLRRATTGNRDPL